MCYKKEFWHDAQDAIIKSSIVLPYYCQRNKDGSNSGTLTDFSDMFEIPKRPKSFTLPNGKVVEVEKEKLDYKFDLS